jgi:hypothetical protein
LEAHQRWLNEGKEWLIAELPEENVHRIDYYQLLEDPKQVINGLIEFCHDFQLPSMKDGKFDEERKAKAIDWVKPEKQHIKVIHGSTSVA